MLYFLTVCQNSAMQVKSSQQFSQNYFSMAFLYNYCYLMGPTLSQQRYETLQRHHSQAGKTIIPVLWYLSQR